MRLHLFIYKCRDCGCEFKAPELPNDPYGVFLMRSETGQNALLRAIERPEFDEVDKLLENHPRVSSLDRYQRAELLHKVFGVACDPAPDGTSYAVNRDPVCPKCGSSCMMEWQATDPPEYVFEEMAEVTHGRWSGLDEVGKRNLLQKALTQAGY